MARSTARWWSAALSVFLAGGLASGWAPLALAQVSEPPAEEEQESVPAAGSPEEAWQQVMGPKDGDTKFAKRGKAVFEVMKHDFGEIYDHEMVETTFTFVNKGEGELLISNIKADCGCTVPELPKKRFAPGESGEVHVKFNPLHKRGILTQNIALTTNDTEQPVVTIQVGARVKPVIMIEPSVLNFNQGIIGETMTQNCAVIGRGEDFAITLATVAGVEGMSVEILSTERVEVDGEMVTRANLAVHFTPTAPGPSQGTISARTNDERRPFVSVPINTTVLGDLLISPDRLVMQRLSPGQDFSYDFKVLNRKGSTFNIEDILYTSTLDKLKITWKPIPPEEAGDMPGYVVTLAGRLPKDAFLLRGTLKIKTDYEMQREAEFQFYGTTRRPN